MMLFSINLNFASLNTPTSCNNALESELHYCNNALYLRIINNSKDSIYLQTKIVDRIKIYYNHKLLKDHNELYNIDDLPTVPVISALDTTYNTEKLIQIGTYYNHPRDIKVDSLLRYYLISQYKELNGVTQINLDELPIILSYLNMVVSLGGGSFVFLAPGESYTFEKKYSCFTKNPGSYVVRCKEKANRLILPKFVKIKANRFATYQYDYKIPYIPPRELDGYKFYTGQIKFKKLKFITTQN